MNDSQVTISNGGVMYSGPDAVNLARAITVRSALRLAKIGMSVRGANKTQLLKIASEYTDRKYKRGQYDLAISDITVWIETMKLAMPVEDTRDV
jgi:hypothetical protein